MPSIFVSLASCPFCEVGIYIYNVYVYIFVGQVTQEQTLMKSHVKKSFSHAKTIKMCGNAAGNQDEKTK